MTSLFVLGTYHYVPLLFGYLSSKFFQNSGCFTPSTVLRTYCAPLAVFISALSVLSRTYWVPFRC